MNKPMNSQGFAAIDTVFNGLMVGAMTFAAVLLVVVQCIAPTVI